MRSPIGLTVASGLIWVASADGDEIVGFDPRDGKLLRRIEVGRTPLRLAGQDAAVWVSVFRGGKAVAVDPISGKATVSAELSGGPEGIAVAADSVWVVRQDDGRLTKLGPTGAIVHHTPIEGSPRLVALDSTHAYVTSYRSGALTRVDRSSPTKVETTGKLCDGIQGVAVHKGVVWVTCTRADEVLAVDAKTLKVLGRVKVPGEPDAIAFAGERLFVAATLGPSLIELSPDPAKPAVLDTRVLGKAALLADRANVDLAFADGRAWVSSHSENLVYSAPLS